MYIPRIGYITSNEIERAILDKSAAERFEGMTLVVIGHDESRKHMIELVLPYVHRVVMIGLVFPRQTIHKYD